MARIRIEDDHLHVELRGVNRIWAMRSGLRVPMSHVRGATADPEAAREPKGFRAPGLHLPGLAAVGTFHRRGEKILYEVFRGTRSVVITLAGESYDRVVVEVDDPRAVVARINAALAPSGH
jgi:hypothetical protein